MLVKGLCQFIFQVEIVHKICVYWQKASGQKIRLCEKNRVYVWFVNFLSATLLKYFNLKEAEKSIRFSESHNLL